jgi:hypothetical protein
LAELYYLGALRFRTSLRRTLDHWVADDEFPPEETERILRLVASENARRIYPLAE